MTQLAGGTRLRPDRGTRSQLLVAGLAAAAWALLLAGDAAGMDGVLAHDELLGRGGFPGPLPLLAFAAAWQVMTAAMMLPSALPVVGSFSRLAAGAARRAGLAVFLASYFAVWTGFGLAALASDAAVHALAGSWGWLAARPSLIPAAVLVLAAAYQFLPVKRRCLESCRDPAGLLGGWDRWQRAWRPGLRHGLACLGSNWALMLVMFALGMHALIWAVLLTLVMVAEKSLPAWRWTVPVTGSGLGAAGILAALA